MATEAESQEPKKPEEQHEGETKEPESQFPLLKDDFVPDVSAKAASVSPPGASAPVAAPAPVAPAPSPAPQATPSGNRFLDLIVEKPPTPIVVPGKTLKAVTRRDLLIYGAGVIAAASGFYWLLPEDTQGRIRNHAPADPNLRKERMLNKILDFDDDVAKALYSPDRLVPTYDKSQAIKEDQLRNNYDGQTPDPSYIDDWTLTVSGLASGKTETLTIHNLLSGFEQHEQVTRLVCVEGWSAIAWWGGLRFADFLQKYPSMPGAKWAKMESSVNLDSDGNSDPYFVSIDLPTAQHPQTLLATHQYGHKLTVEHGAPLRLIAPMKLGLKNIKAITAITYTVDEPNDYWSYRADRGYSRYDGL